MADIKSKEARSRNMAAIKGRDTKPEVYLRSLLFRHGFRFRKYSSIIPGHPDIWLKKYNVAIFVHGCFWHRHTNCKYAYTPKSNVEFWKQKFSANIMRDQVVKEELRMKGIRCIVVWECTIREMVKSSTAESEKLEIIISYIRNGLSYQEL